MPALFLLFRIGRMPCPIPVPWFPVWLVLLPFAALGQAAGAAAALFRPGRGTWPAMLSESMAVWSILPGLHGTEITVSSEAENLSFRFF
jgi:hypothetical protein